MMEIIQYIPELLNGLMVTLILMFFSVTFGLILAIIFTAFSFSDNFLLKKWVELFVFVFRGTPLLVQIFLIYFGVGQFELIRNSVLWVILSQPMYCAIIALAFNSACYTTILLQAGINSIPKDEIAACYAIGMSKWLAFRRIILPRAFRIALPAYSNEVIMVLKGTSLASTITLLDLMGVTQQLIADTYDTIQWYIVAGIIYLLLNLIIVNIFKFLIDWSVLHQHK